MNRQLRDTWQVFRRSKLGMPLTFLVGYLTLSGLFVLFFELARNEEFSNLLDALWWAIITFSTTGYGDKVPVTVGGRLVAVTSVFVGIVTMSFLSGTMASFFVDQSAKSRRGLMDFRKLKDHLVICGWKDHMQDILREILALNPHYNAADIAVVSNVDEAVVEQIKDQKEFKALRFVHGDYWAESTLQRANVSQAHKVLVLADTLESTAASEVDSKTVMAVLTIRAMARDVYVCVELLDKKYEHYLRQAMCDEIILSRDYSRMLLAGSTNTSGISHIVHQMIDRFDPPDRRIRLTTLVIPREFVGQPFTRYSSYVNSQSGRLLLGILENTGSPNAMKLEALREAQKTSDVSQLVNNLREVKALEVNRPVLMPDEEYLIQKHSLGIVLERE